MKGKVSKPAVTALKVKKTKVAWTKESALAFVTKASTKGLKYWGAVDYLVKVHGADRNAYTIASQTSKKAKNSPQRA
jgi:hypothetical protein